MSCPRRALRFWRSRTCCRCFIFAGRCSAASARATTRGARAGWNGRRPRRRRRRTSSPCRWCRSLMPIGSRHREWNLSQNCCAGPRSSWPRMATPNARRRCDFVQATLRSRRFERSRAMSASTRELESLRDRGLLEKQFDDPVQQREAATLGMWAFLSTEILFFGVLFASYTVCRVLYPHGFAAASRETDMLLGSIETAVLLVSSSFVALAVRAVKLDQRALAAWLLAGTAALGA